MFKIFKNKKLLYKTLILIILLLLLIFLFFSTVQAVNCKLIFENEVVDFAEKNENTIFSIDNCTFFSSCDTKNKNLAISNYTIENLYQYTDIALYINNHSSESNLENTIKSMYINNFKITQSPSLGEVHFYYKDINKFTTSEINDSNIITDQLNYHISSEDQTSFETPTMYNNCASPIVLSYVNSNIKTDYTLTNTAIPLTYDGTLLNKCNVNLDSIRCSFSFDIHITNNLDQEFVSTIFITVPLENKEHTTSILNGKYLEKQNTNYLFYRK